MFFFILYERNLWQTKVRFEAACIQAHIALYEEGDHRISIFSKANESVLANMPNRELEAIFCLYPFLNSPRKEKTRNQYDDYDNRSKRALLLRYTLEYHKEPPVQF